MRRSSGLGTERLMLPGAVLLALCLGCTGGPARTLLPTALPRVAPGMAPAPTPEPRAAAGWRERTILRGYWWQTEGPVLADCTPRISPDGRRLLALAPVPGQEGLHSVTLVDLDSGAVQEVASDPGWSCHGAFWSPGGDQIAYARFRADPEAEKPGRAELWVARGDGTQARRLWAGQAPPGGGPQLVVRGWSADGRAVLARGLPLPWGLAGATGLTLAGWPTWQGDPAPGAQPLADDPGAGIGEGCRYKGPGGEFSLAVAEDPRCSGPADGSCATIERRDGRWGRPRTLASLPGRLELLSLSPTGRRLCFMSRADDGINRFWLMDADGTGLRQVTAGAEGVRTLYNPVWSEDETRLFGVSPGEGNHDGVLLMLDIVAGAWQPVYGGWQCPVSLSRDGRRLILVVGAGSQAEVHLLEQQELAFPATRLFWSPEGQFLLLDDGLQPHSPIWRLRADGRGEPEVIVEDGFLLGVVPQWQQLMEARPRNPGAWESLSSSGRLAPTTPRRSPAS